MLANQRRRFYRLESVAGTNRESVTYHCLSGRMSASSHPADTNKMMRKVLCEDNISQYLSYSPQKLSFPFHGLVTRRVSLLSNAHNVIFFQGCREDAGTDVILLNAHKYKLQIQYYNHETSSSSSYPDSKYLQISYVILH